MSLIEILKIIFPDRSTEITKELKDLKNTVASNTQAVAAVSTGFDTVRSNVLALRTDMVTLQVFLGMDGPPGTVTDAQIQATLSKIADISSQVGKFSP